ncbi:MAG: hypothetical protein OIF50_05775 [Flavobacteriaceae bacterium]|nr:hypothetical protein [Flavobacteriaceae bacterium]
MKKVTLLFIGLFLFATSMAVAKEVEDPKPSKKLSLTTQIQSILNKNNVKQVSHMKGEVLFTVNTNREIVVLTVTSNSKSFENFVKTKLNYKKVAVANYREGRTYKVPVRFK